MSDTSRNYRVGNLNDCMCFVIPWTEDRKRLKNDKSVEARALCPGVAIERNMRLSINGSLYKSAHLTEQAEIIELMRMRVVAGSVTAQTRIVSGGEFWPSQRELSQQASIPIRQGGMLANRASAWPRVHFCRSAIAPRLSRPTTWKEFLPISMPTTAIAVLSFFRLSMLLVFGAPCQRNLQAGQEHGRTIPLAGMDCGIEEGTRRNGVKNMSPNGRGLARQTG
jgi:hypothetical protein